MEEFAFEEKILDLVGVCPHCKATQEYSVGRDRKVIWLHRCKQAGNTKIILQSHSCEMLQCGHCKIYYYQLF